MCLIEFTEKYGMGVCENSEHCVQNSINTVVQSKLEYLSELTLKKVPTK